MGLHLCYELHLPADTPESRVLAIMNALRTRALALPLEQVSSLVQFDAREIAQPRPRRGLTYDRLEDVVQFSAKYQRDGLYRAALGLTEDDEYETIDAHTRRYRPVTTPAELSACAIGFAVAPGHGSEPATFALARLCGPEIASRWWWHCCCKTQYASVVSDAHLVRCHTGLVALLDAAAAANIGIEVRDETEYWECRDERVLLNNVAEMNRFVAGFAGAFTDAVRQCGGDSRQVGGTIFDHPDFERFETHARDGSRGSADAPTGAASSDVASANTSSTDAASTSVASTDGPSTDGAPEDDATTDVAPTDKTPHPPKD